MAAELLWTEGLSSQCWAMVVAMGAFSLPDSTPRRLAWFPERRGESVGEAQLCTAVGAWH